MTKLFFVLIMIFLASCAQRMKIPINRMLEPETLGGGLGAEYQDIGYSAGQLDFSNNETNNALLMAQAQEGNFHLDLGLVDKMDIFVDVPKESSTKVGAKVQILGQPLKKRAAGHQLAFSLATGSSHDSFQGDFKINLKSTLQDYSLIHGYRLNENILIYEGVSVTSYTFKGNIENATVLSSNTFQYTANNILGLHAGISMGATGIKAKAEVAAQQVKWTNTETQIFYSFGYSLTAYW